jgi:hypothetical protein
MAKIPGRRRKPVRVEHRLPTGATTFNGYNGYNDETLGIGFLVRCGTRVAASFVGPTLRPYLSAGRYEVKAPPNLDFGGAPGTHYRTQYGDTGELELEGSKGTQIVRPEGYWGYLGYDAYKNDIITIRNDPSSGAVARKTSRTAGPPVLNSTGNLVTPQSLLGPAESFLPPFA